MWQPLSHCYGMMFSIYKNKKHICNLIHYELPAQVFESRIYTASPLLVDGKDSSQITHLFLRSVHRRSPSSIKALLIQNEKYETMFLFSACCGSLVRTHQQMAFDTVEDAGLCVPAPSCTKVLFAFDCVLLYTRLMLSAS